MFRYVVSFVEVFFSWAPYPLNILLIAVVSAFVIRFILAIVKWFWDLLPFT